MKKKIRKTGGYRARKLRMDYPNVKTAQGTCVWRNGMCKKNSLPSLLSTSIAQTSSFLATKCVGDFPHWRFPRASWESNNWIQSGHCIRSWHTPRRSRALSHKTVPYPPLQTPLASPGRHLLTDCVYTGGPYNPLLRFDKLPAWLTELRETVYLLDYHFFFN